MLPLWDTQPHRRPPVFTFLVIVACMVVFGYEMFLMVQAPDSLETFIRTHALVPARLIGGWRDRTQWQTLFTSMFLHGGVAHVLGNCWFLWIFGRSVEARTGSSGFLCIYLAGGVAAAAAQMVFSWGSPIPMLGASGAISGVLGAYLVLFPMAWVVALVPWIVPVVPVPAVVFLLLWFFVQMWSGIGELLGGGGEGGVAWWAHAGGFVTGMLVALLARKAGWLKAGSVSRAVQ
ncbi:MAG: rhomboid family intramembrane serine protease [Opitutaceae bacterium]|nr:rhomboid family intramembrane serine protease [Opitutaceae bacterium]